MYPRTIELENAKLTKLITDKGALVEKGRAVSEEIETLENEMALIDAMLQEEEKKVDISDILEKEKAVSARVDEAIKEMQALKQEIFDRMTAQVPKEPKLRYEEIKTLKEEKETERNKIALKAQKFNDKIIPLGRELMKPFLQDMYEDYDSLYLEDGKVIASIFSHLNEFKLNFKKK